MKCSSTSEGTLSMQTIFLSRFGFQFDGACSTRSYPIVITTSASSNPASA